MARYRDMFQDPDGARWGFPTYAWHTAPDHLATRRQLRARGLCPGGAGVVAQLMWKAGRESRVAYFYDVRRAKPKRTPTPAQLLALAKANAARRTCPICGRDKGYVIPASLGQCPECAER